jgi:hypothetical protein
VVVVLLVLRKRELSDSMPVLDHFSGNSIHYQDKWIRILRYSGESRLQHTVQTNRIC